MPGGTRRVRNSRLVTGGVLGALLHLSTAAGAHPVDARRLIVGVHGETVEIQATPPHAVFAFADDDRNGSLSSEELSRHEGEIRRRFTAGVRVTDGGAPQGDTVAFQVKLPADRVRLPSPGATDRTGEAEGGTFHVVVRETRRFSATLERVSVTYDLFEPTGEAVHLMVTTPYDRLFTALSPADPEYRTAWDPNQPSRLGGGTVRKVVAPEEPEDASEWSAHRIWLLILLGSVIAAGLGVVWYEEQR